MSIHCDFCSVDIFEELKCVRCGIPTTEKFCLRHDRIESTYHIIICRKCKDIWWVDKQTNDVYNKLKNNKNIDVSLLIKFFEDWIEENKIV